MRLREADEGMRRRRSVCEGGGELCGVRRDDEVAARRRRCGFEEESRKVGRKKRNSIRGREFVLWGG